MNHKFERKKRFEPFLSLVKKELGDNVSLDQHRLALAIASYLLDNSFHLTEYDNEFVGFLEYVVDKYGRVNYFDYVDKLELPISDYVKANYDLRNF